ncbi:MAG: acetyl-CoA carboxylase carboxyltransferase subunit alpha [Thermanaeromonas sp.]|uniref:acetyl-CoA carboxylase carboxyltransferase subunit alpha n=1 Tax=Thermanaeromonas sp. TaxID=2003697 RepID=UPI0024405FBB|nr:acetyl-CoA carboxylase carboxyltransferase subunit alpha [Thermanaeromonas sp.]MCG0278321.1 acetyl-CoA carboxylase carboxyltransferase subunit alpha [Thermanaeromonas sp.]
MLVHERNFTELRKRIEELEVFCRERNINLSSEIKLLCERVKMLEEEIYQNLGAFERVHLARLLERPGAMDYIQAIFPDFLELHGDRAYGDDPSIVGGLATLEGIPVTVIGNRRGSDTKENMKYNFGMAHPEGYRKARRLMQQAEKFGRPVITFVDTPGAYPGTGAEERGQGEAIAQNLLVMSGLKVPIIAVLIGQGGSGGALALAVADRLLMLENAFFSVISPEGCASILFKDPGRAAEAAEALKLTARDLYELNLIDEVIPEPVGGAHRDKPGTAEKIKERLVYHLKELLQKHPEELVSSRVARYRKVGWDYL